MKNPFALLVLIVFPVIAVTLSSCSDDIYCPNQQPTEQAKWSTHITMDQAKKRLINIVSEINSQITEEANRLPSLSAASLEKMQCTALDNQSKPLTRSNAATDASCYVIRMDNDIFAIMSATTNQPELLAIGKGNPNFEDSTANLPNPNYWRAPSIGEGVGPDTVSIKTHYVYKRVKTDYTPLYNGGLCKVKWGNYAPYNDKLKMVYDTWGNYVHASTGCVAIALAQLMTTENLRGAYYKDHTFNWDDLAQRKNSEYFTNPTAKEQISTLFEDLVCKENLASSLGSPTTTTYIWRIPLTLANFHFSNVGIDTTYYDYDKENYPPKLDIIKAELDAGYPVLFHADGMSDTGLSDGGHQWLCHGLLEAKTLVEVYEVNSIADFISGNEKGTFVRDFFETSWYLQMNWGWDGDADGYYITSFDKILNNLEGPDIEEIGTPSSTGWNKYIPTSTFFRYGIRK